MDKDMTRAVKELAAILAMLTHADSAAEKKRHAKAFAAFFELIQKEWAKKIPTLAAADKKYLKTAVRTMLKKLHQCAIGTPDACCVGYPSATDKISCIRKGGTWVCDYAPADY